jgi:IS30 family transposase
MSKHTYKHLTQIQRYKIDALFKANHTQAFIAKQLGINKSTISREIKRNSKKPGKYSAVRAQIYANERKERFCKNRRFTSKMQKFIREKLSKEQWSPEQIHGYCKVNDIPMVSHERIYQFIYQDKAEGGMLYKHLRVASKKYRKRYGSSNYHRHLIKDRIFIDHRPEVINAKQRYGDWEIDTIIGKGNKGAIVTVVEIKSAFLLMAKLNGKKPRDLAKAVVRLLAPYKEKVLSITADNGTEFADHKYITQKLKTDFFSAHPYSSWERGLNEYTNRLIRQYIPKKTDFKNYNEQYINMVNMKINSRPRKKLGYKTPIKVLLANFDDDVALAG